MSESQPWLVVGLGNPGAQYADTRHNVGHMCIDVLARRCNERLTSHKSGMRLTRTRLGLLPGGVPGPSVILAISEGFMNVTGAPLSRLMSFLGVTSERLLVLHDELDLPAHELRLKKGGGEGGHNGLKSISRELGTKDYCRLRIGIGRPPTRIDPADFVLARINAKDRTEIDVTVEQAADVVEDVVINGFTCAQMRLHTS